MLSPDEQERMLMETTKVRSVDKHVKREVCPCCRREIGFDKLAAKDTRGEPVLAWHLVARGARECPGSQKSLAEARKIAQRIDRAPDITEQIDKSRNLLQK